MNSAKDVYGMKEICVVERIRLEPRTSLIGISDPTNWAICSKNLESPFVFVSTLYRYNLRHLICISLNIFSRISSLSILMRNGYICRIGILLLWINSSGCWSSAHNLRTGHAGSNESVRISPWLFVEMNFKRKLQSKSHNVSTRMDEKYLIFLNFDFILKSSCIPPVVQIGVDLTIYFSM